MTNRNSPPRAAGAQGSFDCRREAPGGPRTGPQLQAELRPKAIPDQGPVRGPLDPDCRSEAPTGRTGRRMSVIEQGVAMRGFSAVRFGTARRRRWFRAPARCRPEVGVPRAVPAILLVVAYCVGAKNNSAANLFAAGVFGGKCERGDPPFHKSTTTNRNSPPRARRRAREFRLPAEPGRLGVGAPTPAPPAPGSRAAPKAALRFDCRREAPGGPYFHQVSCGTTGPRRLCSVARWMASIRSATTAGTGRPSR